MEAEGKRSLPLLLAVASLATDQSWLASAWGLEGLQLCLDLGFGEIKGLEERFVVGESSL